MHFGSFQTEGALKKPNRRRMAGHEHPHPEHPLAYRVIPTESPSLIKAALHVLADGRSRDAGDILSEAVKAGLLPDGTRRITLYTSLSQYVQRAIARRRRPLFVQDETTHEFRINHPVDDWPHIKPPTRPPAVSAEAIAAIEHRLHSTSTSTLPESFEKAVCDAFGALGFVATHHGGIGAPDGILEAPLGPLAFRTIVECKTAQSGATVNAPRLEEPAKFRDAYKAQFAILVGPALSVDSAFESEMQTHAVSVWTVDDVVNALRLGVGPLDCRELFAAGIVEDRLADLAWERDHPEDKPLAVSRRYCTPWPGTRRRCSSAASM